MTSNFTSPFPNRAPVLGSTATDPMTIRSTFSFSSNPIGFPCLATPTEVQASLMVPEVNIWDSRTEKNPVLSRGWGVNNFLPSAQEMMITIKRFSIHFCSQALSKKDVNCKGIKLNHVYCHLCHNHFQKLPFYLNSIHETKKKNQSSGFRVCSIF